MKRDCSEVDRGSLSTRAANVGPKANLRLPSRRALVMAGGIARIFPESVRVRNPGLLLMSCRSVDTCDPSNLVSSEQHDERPGIRLVRHRSCDRDAFHGFRYVADRMM